MKRIQLLVSGLAVSTGLLMAGGDIIDIIPHEVEVINTIEVVPVSPVVTPEVVVSPAVVQPLADISPIYVGLGISASRYDAKIASVETQRTVDKRVGFLVRAGYDFNQYMGIEARALVSSYKTGGAKIKHIGAFVKPMYPVTNEVNVYGLVGIAKTRTQGSMRRTDATGLAFGTGVEYDFSEDKKKNAKYNREFDGQADQEKGFGVFADYERLYYKKNTVDLDAVSVGLTYDF